MGDRRTARSRVKESAPEKSDDGVLNDEGKLKRKAFEEELERLHGELVKLQE